MVVVVVVVSVDVVVLASMVAVVPVAGSERSWTMACVYVYRLLVLIDERRDLSCPGALVLQARGWWRGADISAQASR